MMKSPVPPGAAVYHGRADRWENAMRVGLRQCRMKNLRTALVMHTRPLILRSLSLNITESYLYSSVDG